MSDNAKKIVSSKKTKKSRDTSGVKPSKKLDLTALRDAIIDGKFTAEKDVRVVFHRTLNGKTRLHAGIVMSSSETVTMIWDETQGQVYSVDPKNHPGVIKIL